MIVTSREILERWYYFQLSVIVWSFFYFFQIWLDWCTTCIMHLVEVCIVTLDNYCICFLLGRYAGWWKISDEFACQSQGQNHLSEGSRGSRLPTRISGSKIPSSMASFSSYYCYYVFLSEQITMLIIIIPKVNINYQWILKKNIVIIIINTRCKVKLSNVPLTSECSLKRVFVLLDFKSSSLNCCIIWKFWNLFVRFTGINMIVVIVIVIIIINHNYYVYYYILKISCNYRVIDRSLYQGRQFPLGPLHQPPPFLSPPLSFTPSLPFPPLLYFLFPSLPHPPPFPLPLSFLFLVLPSLPLSGPKIQLGSLGSAVSSPAKAFWVGLRFEPRNRVWWQRFWFFLCSAISTNSPPDVLNMSPLGILIRSERSPLWVTTRRRWFIFRNEFLSRRFEQLSATQVLL